MTEACENMTWQEENKKQWNDYPCGSVAGFEPGTPEFFDAVDRNRYEVYAPWLKDAVRFDQHGGSVLEVGFGLGSDLFSFAEWGADVYGVDIVERHLELTSMRFKLKGMKADLQLSPGESLPFDSNLFSMAYSFGVLHHTPNAKSVAREMHRVLKPGGEAIIVVYNKLSAVYLLDYMFTRHILRGGFLRRSLQQAKSDIEFHENSNAKPYVEPYTRAGFRELLDMFDDVQIEIHHLEREHFGVFRRLVPMGWIQDLTKYLGWYLLARCKK